MQFAEPNRRWAIDTYVSALKQAVSNVRLERYRPPNGSDHEMIIAYFWNISLCEALYPSLSALDISLRNAIHHAATERYGTDTWFDLPRVLKFRQPDAIIKARAEVSRAGKELTAGRIIAELSFGFWTTLLSDPYHSTFWMPEKATLLKRAFPHLRNHRRIRQDIWHRYDHLRRLRNRVFHFEPIWHRPELILEHEAILETIGWASPTLSTSVSAIDHFPGTYRRGQMTIARQLKRQIGES